MSAPDDDVSSDRPSDRPRDGVHVIELVDDRVRADGGDPTTPRPRSRRRRVTLAAAAAGVVVVAAGALLVSREGPRLFPPSPAEACEDRLTDEVVPEGLGADLSWRTIAHESWPTADLTLLVTEDGGLSGFCAVGDGPDTTTVWTDTSATPGPDEVLPRGTGLGGWPVLWGVAGEDVEAVDVEAEWTDEGGPGPHSSESGLMVEARMTDDGYWSAFFGPGELPEDAEVTLVSHLTNGIPRSVPLAAAWDDAATETDSDSRALADARRDACSAGWRGQGNRPVLESRRDDHGVTMITDPGRGSFTMCVQEADAPYTPFVELSGELPPDDPAPGAVRAATGSGGGRAAVVVGAAGEDVARVAVTTTADVRIEADLVDGYWVAWGADLARSEGTQAERDAGPWDGATLTWYDADGSELGTRPLFE